MACVLMPDHVHLLAHVAPHTALRAFARVLSAFRIRMQAKRALPHPFEWEPPPLPEKVQRDRRHIARTIRYIHLNPARDALCDDPLDWEWSTHRDWVGAVAHPCVDRARWSAAMGRRVESCSEWLHEYVSADVSVRSPRPLENPEPFLSAAPKDASLDALSIAVARVLRSRSRALSEFSTAERLLFLQAASRWTHYRPSELARHVGLHPTNARKAIRRSDGMHADALHAMALTLADPRLLREPRLFREQDMRGKLRPFREPRFPAAPRLVGEPFPAREPYLLGERRLPGEPHLRREPHC